MPIVHRGAWPSPGRSVLAAMAVMIIGGTVLLKLPFAQRIPVGWWDCLFTATSTVCVTGLYTVPLEHFSDGGHGILLMLMQAGSLGLITLSVFFLSLFTTLGLSARTITSEALELEAGQHPRRLVMFTIGFTLASELIGALACYGALDATYGSPVRRFCIALFHAVSSFCHVGITLLPTDAGRLLGGPWLLTVTAVLVVVGSLGFVVWRELAWWIVSRNQQKHQRLSLHTKVVLHATAALILLSAALLFIVHDGRAFLSDWDIGHIGHALFNAICLRSAGFTTMVVGLLPAGTLVLMLLISSIGGAPGSAASGMKVTTVAIFFAAVKATLLRKPVIEMQYRTIPIDQVLKAMALLILTITWAAFFLLTMLFLAPNLAPFDVLFETLSCFFNVGMSRGVLSFLSWGGQACIMGAMLVGRIGVVTVLLALTKQAKPQEFYYPEERILLS